MHPDSIARICKLFKEPRDRFPACRAGTTTLFVVPPATLQRQFRLYIPFLGVARPQPQFPHSCVFERFIYYQDQSTYFLQRNRQTRRGNI
jgi:hypothetical protein